MTTRSRYYPDAALRQQLSLLEFAPGFLSDRAMRGQNPGRRRGDGLEFRQYRDYQQGDDTRLIDWKRYARSDRLYVREADQDAQLVITFVIDCSASMGVMDTGGQSRLDASRALVGALAWLAMHRHQQFCLVQMNAEQLQVLPPGGGADHYRRLLTHLESLSPAGVWPSGMLEELFARLPPRMVLIMVSDFFEHDREHRDVIATMKARANHVALAQLLLDKELDFRERGQLDIIDIETGERRVIASHHYRRIYRPAFANMLNSVEQACRQQGIRLCRASVSHPLADIARAILDEGIDASARLLAGP